MVPDRTEAGGAKMAQDPNLDFVFYDMERNYDIPALKTFMKGLRSASNKTLLVRIPPIGAEPPAPLADAEHHSGNWATRG